MLHIKILYIPNEEKLIRLIQKSQGQVSFLCPGHGLYDLSQENADMELLKTEIRKEKGIDVFLSDKDDYFRFINYMVYAGYE
ncbi:hypothetical protein [Dysosmobacter sp. Phy]